MTFEEALEKAKTVRWKTVSCGDSSCWCRVITTEEPLFYKSVGVEEELYVVGAGSLYKSHAEYIVKIHNEHINQNK